MIRALALAVLFASALPAVQAVEDAGFCKSMCSSERQECRASARKATSNDELLERGPEDRNPFANTANHLQGQSEQERAAGGASSHKRQSERYGACEDKYQRCTRACSIPARPARGS